MPNLSDNSKKIIHFGDTTRSRELSAESKRLRNQFLDSNFELSKRSLIYWYPEIIDDKYDYHYFQNTLDSKLDHAIKCVLSNDYREKWMSLNSEENILVGGNIMSDLVTQFNAAAQRVTKLSRSPTNEEKLQVYAWFKQAKVGDCNKSRPGWLDVSGRAKHDAWVEKKGTSKDDAMRSYIALVDRLVAKYD